uniref:Uncharacterized protein n=1 Tax=Oryza brachyantha TaxID=4533 RepID=J3KXF9_ORYBR
MLGVGCLLLVVCDQDLKPGRLVCYENKTRRGSKAFLALAQGNIDPFLLKF